MPITRYEIQDECTAHMLQSLEMAEAHTKPYPHFWARDFFPDPIYKRMLASAPDTECFGSKESQYGGKRKNGSVNRFSMELIKEKLSGMSDETQELWLGVRNAVGSPVVKRAVFEKLAAGLAYRFGVPEEEAADIEAFPHCSLMRESEGYFIKPHPDTRRKVVTLQIALAQDDTQTGLGTSIYRLNPLQLMREPTGFSEVKRYPFLPNTVFSFSVINTLRLKSWHGRTTLPPGCGFRNTMLNLYYANPTDGTSEIVEEQYSLERAA